MKDYKKNQKLKCTPTLFWDSNTLGTYVKREDATRVNPKATPRKR